MHKSYYDEDYRMSNREKVLNPKRGFGYCMCDRIQIGDWSKCPICGGRNGRRRYKNNRGVTGQAIPERT
jgi:hypothetical protein